MQSWSKEGYTTYASVYTCSETEVSSFCFSLWVETGGEWTVAFGSACLASLQALSEGVKLLLSFLTATLSFWLARLLVAFHRQTERDKEEVEASQDERKREV